MAQLKSTNVLGNLSVTGNILASKFIKLGGTANQILMADGSTLDKSNVGSGTVTSVTVTGNNGLTGTGTITTSGTITLSHADTSSVNNLTATDRTYVKSLTFDGYGHVTGYTTGTETVTNTNTTYSFSGGTNAFTVTPSGGTAQSVGVQSTRIFRQDTRSLNPAPYESGYANTGYLSLHLKSNSTIGITGQSSYSALVEIYPWADKSGGSAHQLVFGTNGAICHRYGTESWSAWQQLATQNWVNDQGFLTEAITGSGTANYIPKFTAEKTIGNSEIIDNGSNVYPSSNLGNALGHANYVWDRLYVRQIDLNRTKGTTYGRINFYSPSYYTWYEYMSNNGVASPTGANTIQYGEVTTWARRSLIEHNSGYGWIWEACANGSGTTPVGKMALSSNTGNLMTAGSTKSTAFILHSSGTTKATFAYNASDDCVELTFA